MTHPEIKAPFADQIPKHDKRSAGRTDVSETPLELRYVNGEIDDELRAWIHDRLGRQLGKYAPQIERLEVRFVDENGSKGGVDKACMIHLVLSKLPPVVVETRAASEREAFDLAAKRVERATQRDMKKHGVSTHRSQHASAHGAEVAAADGDGDASDQPEQRDDTLPASSP